LSNWIGTTNIISLAYDSANGLVYIAGNSGLFGYYNISDNRTYDLRGTDLSNWIGTTNLMELTYDSNNDLIYLVGYGAAFGYYNISDNRTYDLRGTDPENWIGGFFVTTADSLKIIRGVSYDASNDLVYFAGGDEGLFGYYNISDNTSYDLTGTDAGNWISKTIFAVDYDASNDLIYIGGKSGLFGYYNISDNRTYDLRATDTENWVGDTVNDDIYAVHNLDNGLTYFGGQKGIFGYYNRTLNMTTDLNTPTDWIRFRAIEALASDTDDNTIYFGGPDTLFGFYNVSGDEKEDLRETYLDDWINPQATLGLDAIIHVNGRVYIGGSLSHIFGFYNKTENITYDLRATFPSAWSNYCCIYDLAYDSVNDLIYFVGARIFGYYNIRDNTTVDLTATDTGNWIGTNTINGVIYNPNNGFVYLGGQNGIFGYYDLTTNTSYNLNNTDIGNWVGTSHILEIAIDSESNYIYIAPSTKFGVYNVNENKTYSLAGTVPSDFLTSKAIYDMDYDFVNNLLFVVGGVGSIFGTYNKTSNTTEDLSSTDTRNWIGNLKLYGVKFHPSNNLTYFAGEQGVFGYYNRTSNTTTIVADTIVVPAASGDNEVGGGGLVKPPVTAASQTISVPRISGGGSASTAINNPLIDIRNITIFPKEDIENASLTVEQNPPTQELINFAIPFGTFYQAFSVTPKEIENEKLNNVTLEFRVNKTWLAEQNYSYDNIALYRIENETSPWQKLPTVSIENNTDYYYFTAVSPGFSTFVIVANEKALACTSLQTRCFNNEVQTCDENSEWVTQEVCFETCYNGQCLIGQREKILFYSLIIFLASGILIAGYLLFRKVKAKKK
jgi:PGF-pre-PGF domain-containing protein